MGPNTNDESLMRKLVQNGMDIARFNFSHGDHEEQKGRMDMLKKIREEENKPIAILLDTKGPEIRTGVLKDGKKVQLEAGVIGYANFRFLAGEGELMRIAVLPEHRGCGESKKLMDRLEISAKEKEAPDLTLEVRAGNTPAINLYKSYGFQAEAVRKNYYQNPVEDALIMWRRSVPSIPT